MQLREMVQHLQHFYEESDRPHSGLVIPKRTTRQDRPAETAIELKQAA